MSRRGIASAGSAAVLLFAVSFALRAAVFLAVSPLRPAFDEKVYVQRGEAIAELAQTLAEGERPSPRSLERMYAEGVWPPLYPALVAVGLGHGSDATGARWIGVLVSSATSVLIFFVTGRIAGRRAAVAAAALHAVHPSFVAYAHLLWSETLFVAVLVCAVLAALATCSARTGARRAGGAVACGVALGLAALTRASGATALIAVPAWLLFALDRSQRRFAHAALAFVTALVVISPWQVVLYANEGHPVVLSTAAGYNLLKLNSDFTSKAAVRAAIDEYAAEHAVAENRAGTTLALRAIADDLPRFVERCALRFRRVFGMDEFVLRHLVHVIYPPLPGALLFGIFALLAATPLVWTGLTAIGVASGAGSAPGRALLLLLIATGLAAPVIAIGNSRMGLPLIALGIPFAGIGLANLRALERIPVRVAAGTLVLLCLASLATLPADRSASALRAGFVSGWYRELADPTGWLKPPGSATLDCVKLRVNAPVDPDEIEIRSKDVAYTFLETGGTRLVWNTGGERSRIMDVAAQAGAGRLVLELRSRETGASALLHPLEQNLHRTWQPSGLPGIDARWCGVRSSHQGRDF
ncbi:MAG: glycosyltransferase family 39 protein [Myxococcales bacterium]|nr:glycosyltransferase family 39 protein [Myxococcales bacterium]